jgi:hypothetical protein
MPLRLWLDWFYPQRSGAAAAAPPAPHAPPQAAADDQDYDDIA